MSASQQKNAAVVDGSMICVSRASTALCTRHNIASREENIFSSVQTLAKTSSGLLLRVLIAFKKNQKWNRQALERDSEMRDPVVKKKKEKKKVLLGLHKSVGESRGNSR